MLPAKKEMSESPTGLSSEIDGIKSCRVSSHISKKEVASVDHFYVFVRINYQDECPTLYSQLVSKIWLPLTLKIKYSIWHYNYLSKIDFKNIQDILILLLTTKKVITKDICITLSLKEKSSCHHLKNKIFFTFLFYFQWNGIIHKFIQAQDSLLYI